MLDNNPFVPEASSVDPKDTIFFSHDWDNASPKLVDWFRSVMVDEKGETRKDGNISHN